MIRKAVIVAAGLSSRLYPLTANTPKPLLPVSGESLLERSVRLLNDNGIEEVGIVVGFRAKMVQESVGGPITWISNPFYQHCNNMGSLWMAKAFVGEDPFAYLHGDLIFTGRLLSDFLDATRATRASAHLLTAFGPVDAEAMKVRTDAGGRLIESSKAIPLAEAQGEWTGIAAIHRPGLLFAELERHLMNDGLADYDTAAFTSLAAAGVQLNCLPTSGEPWKEIDTPDDWEAARLEFEGVE